jgi:hypothetical protein
MSSPFAGKAFRFPPGSVQAKKAAAFEYLAGSERLSSVRTASRLEVRAKPEMLSTGISQLDSITGGIPRGRLTEIYGPRSSGKTSALLSILATATRGRESCVLIDANDSFDPHSAVARGVILNQLLWIRLGGEPTSQTAGHRSSWRKLEQVLKTTDLLIESGGFGLIALDVAGISNGFLRRIPLASWFRFVRTVEHTKTALLVVSESACSGTCAALVIRFCPQASALKIQAPGALTHREILEGLRVEAEVVRARLDRRPPQSVKTVLKTEAIGA